MVTEKYIPIAESALRNMLESQHLYQALVQGGVESWEWGDTAITQYLDELGAESIDEFVNIDVDGFEREAESLHFPIESYDGKVEKVKLHYWGENAEIFDKIVEIKVPKGYARGEAILAEKMNWWAEKVQFVCPEVKSYLQDFYRAACDCLGLEYEVNQFGWTGALNSKLHDLERWFVDNIIGVVPIHE